MDAHQRENKTLEILKQNELAATENLRSAIYTYELKTVSNLQFINGGGAAVLVGFLSGASLNAQMKFYFSLSISCFLLGLIFSVILSFISPKFLESRFRQGEDQNEYKKYNCLRTTSLLSSLIFFILAILFSMLGWYSS